MITYQVTINVDAEIESEWLSWMKTEHVPDVIATGLVCAFHILQSESSKGVYLFHYQFISRADFETYQSSYAPELKRHPAQKFPNSFNVERDVFLWI